MTPKIIPGVTEANASVCTLAATISVRDAARAMAENRQTAAVVMSYAGQLEGIVTESDIARRAVAPGLDVNTTPVADIMTANPDTLRADDTALDALALMRARAFRHLPVVDENGNVLAMVTAPMLAETVESALLGVLADKADSVFGPDGPATA